jgi:predicted O-methyltransferase YrrM
MNAVKLKDALKRSRYVNRVLTRLEIRLVPVRWVRKTERSWLAGQFDGDFIRSEPTAYSLEIESLARETNALGPQPLWEGYAANDANAGGSTRTPDKVRTAAAIGDLFTSLVIQRRPRTVVEFGAAFGVSGMYFLAGLEANGAGTLLTFEPNRTWARRAENNLKSIGNKFTLTVGTFEDHIDACLAPGQRIDLAFIDAIHTKQFVIPQLELVLARSSSKALVILDDIDFSPDMRECWREAAADGRFSSALELGNRAGVLELGD